jgi:hypothetical protein
MDTLTVFMVLYTMYIGILYYRCRNYERRYYMGAFHVSCLYVIIAIITIFMQNA